MARNPNALKPYAIHADQSRGREHAESFPAHHDPFALDRQRIFHSTAFRRLIHKTQVFVTHEHDHFRTRLTHTLEVASIARRLCTALQVNEAVGELIALAHDLGHPPFGHAGEKTLHARLTDHGGFEHNAQSLRVIEYLEHPYPSFRGLNATYEVRESLAKHCTLYDKPGQHALADGSQAPLEGQIANLADRITYDCHDLEDAIGANLITEEQLRDVPLWEKAIGEVRKQWPDKPLAAIRRPVLDRLESAMLNDVVRESKQRIKAANIATLDDVRAHDEPLVGFTAVFEPYLKELEQFNFENIYRHQFVIRMDDKARRFVERLFDAYLDEPRLLPDRYYYRIDEQGKHRVVADYIAGMTDRYCQDEHRRLFDPHERV